MTEFDKGNITLQITNQLKSAYRKYKTTIYYDSYSAIQRLNLSKFESNPKINENEYEMDKIFEELAQIIVDKDKFKQLTEDICNEIDVIAFPKEMKNNTNEDDNNIIRNFHVKTEKIERLYYFIDLPVIGQILGVLWILRCGYLLDDKLYKNCYGNRLNKYLLEKLKNKNSDYYIKDNCYEFTPFLFTPYFKNYESWRDDGLEKVNNLLEHDQNVIMFSLDLKEFYYRSLIDFKSLRFDIQDTRKRINKRNDYEDSETDEYNFNVEIDKRLTNFIEKVFCEYSNRFIRDYSLNPSTRNSEYAIKNKHKINTQDYPMIPLGFAPSLIISNWYLQGLDQAIIENVSPHYYGRYVDDLLIVLGSHEKSESHGAQQIENQSSEMLIEKYLTHNNEDPEVSIFFKDPDNTNNYRIYNQHFENSQKREIKYNYEGLEIQRKKLKTYYFSNKHSNAMIENFKNEIKKNSSEFRLMHDLDTIKKDFKKNLYKIDYKESINKLGDINKVGINKFEISKILSRINWVSSDTNDTIDDGLINDIIGAFEGKIFDYITLWEKLFTLLIINNKYEKLTQLISFIQKNISNLKFQPQKENTYTYTMKKYDDLLVLKKSLRKFLYSTLIRIFSLKYNSNIKKIIENIEFGFKFSQNTQFPEQICNCLSSSMQNNSLMKYPLEDLSETIKRIQENANYSFNLIKKENKPVEFFNGFCYPRFVKLHECILHFITNEILKNEHKDNYISLAFEKYNEINFDDSTVSKYHIKEKCDLPCIENKCPLKFFSEKQFKDLHIIKTIGKQKDTVKIGLLNTKLNFRNFKQRLLKQPNLKSERFDEIKKLINEAISKKVELLVMPEMYIPYEWVEKIVKISKDHQMAIIFGVEPIEHDGIGNYIMMSLPFIFNDKYLECGIIYRLKNHYAPEELRQYEKYGKKAHKEKIDKYYMCIWKGIHIVPYYCYEIASLDDRSIFKSCCDIVTVSEFNKDTQYFNNIAESLSRDLYCYCIKSNTSEFGGSCIIQPTSSESKYIVNLKGGEDDYIVTQDLNIKKLRENAIESDLIENNSNFKPKPPGFCKEHVWARMNDYKDY